MRYDLILTKERINIAKREDLMTFNEQKETLSL